jgi:dihydropyrimidinase
MLNHAIDYTPFEGMEFKNWPRYTIIRGKVVYREGKIVSEKSFGQFQRRGKSQLPGPRDVWLSEWRP